MMAVWMCLDLALLVADAPATFRDLGIGAPVAERRNLIALRDAAGRDVAVATTLDLSPAGYVLLTDLVSGQTTQLEYPAGVPNNAPFVAMLSRNGYVYVMAGPHLLELDVEQGLWRFHGVPAPGQAHCTGKAMVDGPDGRIYIGLHPGCHLAAYDPKTHEMIDYGPMDEQEHYFSFLAFDQSGWAYAGLGTARQNLVAFHPPTRERRQLVDEADRAQGTSEVRLGTDGQVYGVANRQWYRLAEGRKTVIDGTKTPAPAESGTVGYGGSLQRLSPGRRIERYDLEERRIIVHDPDGKAREIPLAYRSEGTMLTSVAAGPDGRIYASSAHPMHLACYDPRQDKLSDLGPVAGVGGGNFCSMAAQGPYLIGVAYSSGKLYAYDTRQPFNRGLGDAPNPKALAQFAPDITRPRAALAHPDGRHVLMAGYMGYGYRGGGLGIVDLETGTPTLLKHTELIPDQSTYTLDALPDGTLVGGTSIYTPGGGHATAKEAVLYLFDWATRKVVHQVAPVAGCPHLESVRVGRDGMVYGVTQSSDLFVFDPARRAVVHTATLKEYGAAPRHGLHPADGKVYALFANAVLEIAPGTWQVTKVAAPPVPVAAGGALLDGSLYYAAGTHVWRCDLPR